jgi:hypothetical protein
MIDKATVSLYACCKCNHRWIVGWDPAGNKEYPVPSYCPKCKNFRWNQHYTQEEEFLFGQVHEQHTIKRVKGVLEYEQILAQMSGRKADDATHMVTVDYLDLIAYDFLYEISPQPEMFELKQLLAIPKKNTEARHEFMLSVIRDRIDNAAKYERERFSKYGDSYLLYGNDKRDHDLDKIPRQRKRKYEKPVKGCKHTIRKVRKLEKLIDQRKDQNNKKVKKKWEDQRQQRLQEEKEWKERMMAQRESDDEYIRTIRLQDKAKELEELEIERNK